MTTEFAFPATLAMGSNGIDTVTAFNFDVEQPVHFADANHPNWDEIITGLRTGNPNVWDLFDVAGGIMRRFQQITDRVSYDGQSVLWDGDPVHSVLADQLERAIIDGDSRNYTALAKFWESLMSNPNEHSREQTFDFLAAHSFQITEEGKVVAFKGVQMNPGGKHTYRSGRKSEKPGVPSAFVDGIAIPELSYVPQSIGSVVSMPRSEVKHDPNQTCERGLHISTKSYAASWGAGGAVLEVHAWPRDFVSVPNGAGGEKVRVCRYEVAGVAKDEYGNAPVLRPTSTNTWQGDVGYRVR